MKIVFLTAILIFSANIAGAVCNPAPQGAFAYRNSGLFVCDGTAWKTVGDANAISLCLFADAGKQKYDFDTFQGFTGMMYCNGSSWLSMHYSVTGNACPTPGTIRYDSGTGVGQFCNSNNVWVDMSDPTPSITFCGVHGTQPVCDADYECYWTGAACASCPCNRH